MIRVTTSIRPASSMFGGPGGGKGSGGYVQFLLPPQTFWETATTALEGAWGHLTDQKARDAYEVAVQDQVIKDKVLAAANNGTVLTYSLFANLQNPLLTKHQFDAKEFMRVVGPALENFHETLATLRNDLPTLLEQKRNQKQSDAENGDANKSSDGSGSIELLDFVKALIGTNYWHEQAQSDSTCLAAHLSRMTSKFCFDSLYYTSNLDVVRAAAPLLALNPLESTPSSSSSEGHDGRHVASTFSKYIQGSCLVGEVALIRARAMVLDQEMNQRASDNDDDGNDEVQARDNMNNQEDAPVAAQMDVLYEVTEVYDQPAGLLDPMRLRVEESDAGSDVNFSNDEDDAEKGNRRERISQTNLVVAVLEGFLHGGPDNALRWKVANIRAADEFPHQMTRRRLS